MLNTLTIRDFVIIESLDLSFDKGMSALTGETGAGKSILLDALGILMGRRSESSLIRKGAQQATISAEFSLPSDHPAHQILSDQSIPCEGSILIRRIISLDGRGRAFINDQPVSVALLRQLGDQLVEIHGQFDRLMDVSSHRRLLDAFVKEPALLDEVKQSFHLWQEALLAHRQAEERLDNLKRHEDFLRYQLSELESLQLKEGEEEELLAQRENLSGASKVFDVVGQAYGALDQSQTLDALKQAHWALQKFQSGLSPNIDQAMGCLERAVSETTEALAQLEDIQNQVEDQPQRLQAIDDRLHQLRGIARKHNTTVAELSTFYTQLRQDLDDLDQAEVRVTELLHRAKATQQNYLTRAQGLHDRRVTMAKALDEAVMVEMPSLKLPNALFHTVVAELEEAQWHEAGIDRVNFQVAMNKGQDLCPLEKAASGGELARLMLSLKAILSKASVVSTMIFDEIDIGVGGAVAAAIGQRLSKLAEEVQVLVITHSPQVAAVADHHFQVAKADEGLQVRTNVIQLPLPRRHEELARMLSGAEVTEEARAAARSLLARFG